MTPLTNYTILTTCLKNSPTEKCEAQDESKAWNIIEIKSMHNISTTATYIAHSSIIPLASLRGERALSSPSFFIMEGDNESG